MKLLVVGGGAAGTAAAWMAACAGAEVELIHHRAGATELYSGALDLESWERGRSESADPAIQEFSTELGIWALSARGCWLATGSGVVRPATGADTSLLDLGLLAGRKIAVADVERDGWDGEWLARALGGSSWAEQTGTEFLPVRIRLVEAEHERRFGAYDFACLHDAPERVDRLAEELGRSSAGMDGWLLGPWLGVGGTGLARLRGAVRRPVGETTSPPDGPAGARFARARSALLQTLGVTSHRARATELGAADGGWVVRCEVPGAGSKSLEAEKVVLAVGGLVSGGVRLNGPVPEMGAGAPLSLSLEAPVRFELDGAELERVSSLHGMDWQAHGLAALERVGVAAEGSRVVGASGVFVAGSVMAGRPRTTLEAVRAGIVAAQAALG